MADDKVPKARTYPPPPMDPFPTYQTPFPRTKNDDEQNPFIQFRRFADEQFSSFFSGFPQFFGVSPGSSGGGSEHRKQEVEDIMRQRQEWEEGFRKKFEQEMEEVRLQLEKSKIDAWKSMEDAWKQHTSTKEEKDTTSPPAPWWTKGQAAKCPALNGREPQRNAQKCPALYDEQGQPRTELDAYIALQDRNDKQVQVFQATNQESTRKAAPSWLSGLGWDGRQKEQHPESSSSTPEKQPGNGRIRQPPLSSYSFLAHRRMQPFDNTNDTIPWLMLSPYSPIYLCNPAQSRLLKVKVQDSEGEPLQIADAKFLARWYTEVDEKMATSKPWADAFEDLLSLQQTGSMVKRDDWNTWRTPSTWIHDMASRGSLGDRWGFNDQGLLVKRALSSNGIAELPAMSKKDRCSRWRKHRADRRRRSSELQTEVSELPATEDSPIVDKVAETLAPFPLFGSILSAADAIVTAVDQAAQKEFQARAESEKTSPPLVEAGLPLATPAAVNASSSSEHSSSSVFHVSNLSTSSAENSIISTLTTTTTRTLPNGSVETKRALKRRFADGSEEKDESVEVTNQSSQRNRPVANQLSSPIGQNILTKNKETQTQVQPLPGQPPKPAAASSAPLQAPEAGSVEYGIPSRSEANTSQPQRRGSGWFWN